MCRCNGATQVFLGDYRYSSASQLITPYPLLPGVCVNFVKSMYNLNYNTCITYISSKLKRGHQNDAHEFYLQAFFESTCRQNGYRVRALELYTTAEAVNNIVADGKCKSIA